MPDNLTPDALVRREVHYCVSSLVSTLAAGYGADVRTGLAASGRDLSDLFEQAFELAAPIDDWEEAALQAGWSYAAGDNGESWHGWFKHVDGEELRAETAEDACRQNNGATNDDFIEPYQREVYEHWIVSDWLADKLEARGEKVDRDFAGMTIWARTTTGQAIALDSVIESICRDLPGEIEAALAAISTPKAEG